MGLVHEDVLIIIEKSERKRVFSKLHALAVEEKHVPPTPFLYLSKTAPSLQYIGGILIGSSIGVLSFLFNFILFVYLLHMEF